jgi:hypothetical protein
VFRFVCGVSKDELNSVREADEFDLQAWTTLYRYFQAADCLEVPFEDE